MEEWRELEIEYWRRVIERLERVEQEVLKLAHPNPGPAIATSFGIKFEQRRKKMPLSLPLNLLDEEYFIIGTDAGGNAGAQLGLGQTITVVSADPTIVNLVSDATAGTDNEGVVSIASGKVTPVKVGGPVNATWTVTNVDGSVAEIAIDTITVTSAVAGVATSIGVLFV
jgi:hypothetical protein